VEQAFREAKTPLAVSMRIPGDLLREAMAVQVQRDRRRTFEDQDIVDPAKEYATKRFLQMNAYLRL